MYHCRRTTTLVKDEMGTPYDSYGIIVRQEDGEIVFLAEDLTFHLSSIEKLVCDWNRLQPEPVHFQEIVEDFIETEHLG